MSPFRFFVALNAVLLGLLSLPARADLKVVTTLPDLAAITKAVGGEHVQVTSLSLPTQDPHFVDARPSQTLEVNRADLLIAIGLELEVGWLPTFQNGARNTRILTGSPGYLEAAQFVRTLEVPTTRVDRSQGDIHAGGNPHFLYDPRAALQVARGITDRMASLDQKNAAAYRANLEKFTAELEKARAGWEQRLAGLKGVPVVAFHRTTAYLSNWLGFDTIAYLEPKPGIPPNPAHMAQVVIQARQRKARFILQENYYPTTNSKPVASKIPAPLILFTSGTDFRGGQTYIQHLEDLVTKLENGLKGQGT
ncbi:ABC transporter substrate-binding protein [Archangium sp. Cb G35]|uniref:metal ABC transporter substrate-binding protein n=1 Tax=Archangium sp. Cb G35 TaxID=1920190 RepID=UPI000936C107|nr:metal ABC transporter substrate-binding protein [Archangium sp. Cb G35]OJT20310.1 ABC transporter substrate-binding protein [Archangium sp. Cb G35]